MVESVSKIVDKEVDCGGADPPLVLANTVPLAMFGREMVPVVVIVPPVKPPAAVIEVKVPPEPVAEMLIAPAELLIVTPDPAVRVAKAGAAPVEPISNCPLIIAPASIIWPPEETIICLLERAVEESRFRHWRSPPRRSAGMLAKSDLGRSHYPWLLNNSEFVHLNMPKLLRKNFRSHWIECRSYSKREKQGLRRRLCWDPQKHFFADWFAKLKLRVPLELTGELATEKILGADKPTLVTDPRLPEVQVGAAEVPCVVKY